MKKVFKSGWAVGLLGLAIMLSIAALSAVPAHAETFNVNSVWDLPDDNPGDGVCAATITLPPYNDQVLEFKVCTLRAAVMEANAFPGADVINLRARTYRLNYKECPYDNYYNYDNYDSIGFVGITEDQGACGDLDLKDKLNIVGAGKDRTIIDGSALYERVFDVHDGSVVDIKDLTVRGGQALGDVNLEEGQPIQYNSLFCPIIEPSDKGDGGGLLNRGGIVYLTNMAFENNLAICDGGGVDTINDGITVIDGNEFLENVALVDGGGLMVDDDSITSIEESEFIRNNAYENGGAIAGNDALVWISNVSVRFNTAQGYGGGIWNSRSDVMVIQDSTVWLNDVPGTYESDGGGIFNDDGFVLKSTTSVRWNSPNDYVDWNEPQGFPFAN